MLLALPTALAGWFAGMLLLTPLLEPTSEVFVIGPSSTLAELPKTGSLLVDAVGGMPRVRGASPGFVKRLYAQGAWLVLPARSGGCSAAAYRASTIAKL
ncbi:MAG: hypothetical protein ACRCWF_13975 [Beijerinckiaceae bacterium]